MAKKALRDLLSNERQALIDAISQDFSHRSADETLLAELMPSLHGIHYASQHLKGWMKASQRKVGVGLSTGVGQSRLSAAGRGRGDRAVELSAVSGHRAVGGRVVGGQPGDAQAQRIDPGHRFAAQGIAGRESSSKTWSAWCSAKPISAWRSPDCASITCCSPAPPASANT